MAVAKSSKPRRRVRKAAENSKEVASKPATKQSLLRRVFTPVGRLLKPIKPFFSFLGRILRRFVPRYFVNSFREVRKVTWPTRGETWRLTLAVFIFAAVFGTLVAIVDKGLDEIFKKLVLR